MESIPKAFSVDEDEEIWHFKDRKHCEDIYSKLMQDESIKVLGNKFFGLINHAKKWSRGASAI